MGTRIRYNQIADLDLITEKEAGAGYATDTLDPDVYPLSVTGTTTSTFTISGADLTGLRISEDDIVRVVGGGAAGDYRVQQVVDATTLEVKGSVPSASSGDLTLYHQPGSERVGVNEQSLTNLSGSTVQAVLEDLDQATSASSLVAIPLGPGIAANTGWTALGRARFDEADYNGANAALVVEAEASADGVPGELELWDVTDWIAPTQVGSTMDCGVTRPVEIVVPIPSGSGDRVFELRGRVNGGAWDEQVIVHTAAILIGSNAPTVANNAPAPVTLTTTGYVDTDTFGAEQANLALWANAISGTDTFGTPTGLYTMVVNGLVDADTFGAHASSRALPATGMSGADAFGVSQTDLALAMVGLADADVFGAALASELTYLEQTNEATYSPSTWSADSSLQLGATGIVDADQLGTHTTQLGLGATGLADADTFGVSAVAPDGFIYSASYDDTVKKLNPDGTEVWSFTGHTGTVYGVAVDADGYVYSAALDDTVRKIDPSGTEVWSFTGHTGTVYGVAVDADGYVYSGSDDQTVRKIDPNGNQVWSFTGHTGSVWGGAADPGTVGAFPAAWGVDPLRSITNIRHFWNVDETAEADGDILTSIPDPVGSTPMNAPGGTAIQKTTLPSGRKGVQFFGGSNDYMEAGGLSTFNYLHEGPGAAMLTFRVDDTGASVIDPMRNGFTSGENGFSTFWDNRGAGEKFGMNVARGVSGSPTYDFRPSVSWKDGNWHTIVISWDNDFITVWLDGASPIQRSRENPFGSGDAALPMYLGSMPTRINACAVAAPIICDGPITSADAQLYHDEMTP